MPSSEIIVRQYYEHLKNRNRAALLALLSPSIRVVYRSQADQFPWSGEFLGHDGFDRFLSLLKSHLNVLDASITHSTATESTVINQCSGRWEYIKSGYVVTGDMVNVFHIQDNQISGYEVYADTAAFMAGLQQDTDI